MASTTKLMTAYLALRELPLDERLVAPPYHPIPGESLLGLEAGERMSVRDLLYGLLLPSGNDAAVTLADGVAGSAAAFVGGDEPRRRRLGLRRDELREPDRPRRSPATTRARATWRSWRCDLRRERLFRRIVDTPQNDASHRRPPADDRQPQRPRARRSRGSTASRPATRRDAGYVLVGSGTRKGVTLLSVVMGAPSEAARDDDTLALLRYGFSLYRRETPGAGRGRRWRAPAVRGRASERCRWWRPRRLRVTAQARPRPFGWRSTRPTHGRGADPRAASALGTARGHPGRRAGRPRAAGRRAPASRRPTTSLVGAGRTTLLPGPRAVVWAAHRGAGGRDRDRHCACADAAAAGR